MRVLEVTEILCFGRVRGAYLTGFDCQLGLPQSPATEQLFI